jgi:polyisoprenoid-binding protein YceI
MKLRRPALFAVAVAVVFAFVALASAQEYKIDKGHSQVGFSARHVMISNVSGRFTEFEGMISFDPKDVTKSTVKVTVKTPSITTDNAGRDNDLRNSEFLEVAKYPEMSFQSTRIEKRGSQLVLIGNLTLKDVTRQVEIPFTLSGPITDPWGNLRIAAEGSTTINRRDFHVTYNHLMQDGSAVVGDQVRITLAIEGVRPKGQ